MKFLRTLYAWFHVARAVTCKHPNRAPVSQHPDGRFEYYCSDCDAYWFE